MTGFYGTSDKKQAANYLNIKEKTLDVWNCTKRYNLKYIKVGRLIRYRQEDLDQFLAERTVSQNGGEGEILKYLFPIIRGN